MKTLNIIKTIVQVRALKGAKFVSIKGYTNKQNEVSNQTIVTNINYENLLKKDAKKLKEFNPNSITKFDTNLVHEVYLEMAENLVMLMDKELKKKALAEGNSTAIRSKAQTDAYTSLGNGLRINNKNKQLYLYGLVVHKHTIKQGEYSEVEHEVKTLIRKAITKSCKLRSDKFRNFSIGNMDEIIISGVTI